MSYSVRVVVGEMRGEIVVELRNVLEKENVKVSDFCDRVRGRVREIP